VLFGGRYLEGLGTHRKNKDGSIGERFDKSVDLESDYTSTGVLHVDWEHGMDVDRVGNNKDIVLGYVDWKTAKRDERGVFVERVLNRRNRYMQYLEALIQAGLVGNSTEPAQMGVEKSIDGTITRWPLVRDTLTVNPMEPRMLSNNNLQALYKSLITPEAVAEADKTIETAGKPSPAPKDMEDQKMDDNLKAEINAAVKSAMLETVPEIVKATALQFAESQATVKAGTLTNVVDEADRAASGNPFTGGDFYKSVIDFARYGEIDKRLLPLKATGANESTPSQGGFLLPQNMRNAMKERMTKTGQILQLLNVDGITQGNGMSQWGIDETSRADGSRDGGVLAYWTGEAGTITATKPKWREVNLKLNDVTALIYATNDMLEDQNYLQSWISRKAPDALRFKVELASLFGDGGGKPRGPFGTSDAPHPAQKTFARENASAVTFADVVQMWAFRDASLTDYVWLINQSVEPQLLSMVLATYNPVYMPAGGLSGAPYGSLFGRPVITTEYNPILGTQNDICLFSPSQVVAIDRPGIKADSSIHVAFVTNESAFRFVYRYDSQPTWYSTLTPFGGSSSDALSPFVSLTASS
jgi:HK97 family phage major capsid protein